MARSWSGPEHVRVMMTPEGRWPLRAQCPPLEHRPTPATGQLSVHTPAGRLGGHLYSARSGLVCNLQSSFPYRDRQHRQGPRASTIPAPLSV